MRKLKEKIKFNFAWWLMGFLKLIGKDKAWGKKVLENYDASFDSDWPCDHWHLNTHPWIVYRHEYGIFGLKRNLTFRKQIASLRVIIKDLEQIEKKFKSEKTK